MNASKPISPNPLLLAAIALSLAGLLVALLFWQPARPGADNAAPAGGDFQLNSQAGPVSLSDFRGKLVLLYFGYTQCPDICPTSLAFLTQAVNELSAEEQARLQVIFISVDPERDSLEHLQVYSSYFHPDYIGLTASPAQVRQVADNYGAGYRRVDSDSEMGYIIDHTAELYLVDAQGQLQTRIPHGTEPEQILQVLRQWLPTPP
ncbi:MAG: SCO family protein [Gammaproteobacteria bacterium SHHR-1]|uniref:SCO family protein n=1 Tax=Magnetovirga frankeli TaxID=947516 RepID=UPI001293201F|nr:SCO family protein [gamma proteobacterium SS-5]